MDDEHQQQLLNRLLLYQKELIQEIVEVMKIVIDLTENIYHRKLTRKKCLDDNVDQIKLKLEMCRTGSGIKNLCSYIIIRKGRSIIRTLSLSTHYL